MGSNFSCYFQIEINTSTSNFKVKNSHIVWNELTDDLIYIKKNVVSYENLWKSFRQ